MFSNFTFFANKAQMIFLVEKNLIDIIYIGLDFEDPKLVYNSLITLENLLNFGRNLSEITQNPILRYLETNKQFFSKLEELSINSQKSIVEQASKIIEEFYNMN